MSTKQMAMSYPYYLLSIGYKSFRKTYNKKSGWAYVPCEFTNDYSSMVDGKMDYRFIPNGEIILNGEHAIGEIVWGLHEMYMPPTLCHLIFETDNETNRFIMSHTNEELHAIVIKHISR